MSLNVVETGDGTPVLAVHGWSCDHRLMTGCLEPVLAERPGYRRIYPDLPGMGRSPAAGARSSDDLLRALDTLVEERIGQEPFLLVGQSYGGYLARALARLRSPQVLGLALICPVGAVLDRSRRTRPPRQVLRRDDALVAGLDADLRDAFTPMAVVQDGDALRRFRDQVLPGLELADADALARIEERWDLTEGVEGPEPFERPTLLLAGRQDADVGYVDQLALLDHYPRATVAVLDVAGHSLQLEQPALFAALVREWLDRVESERAG